MKKNQQGFTLVELMLATAIFSFVLVFVVAGFVQINRAFTKGILVKRTQETARLIIEELSRSVASTIDGGGVNSSITLIDTPTQKRFCVEGSGIRYAWNEGYRGSPGHEVMYDRWAPDPHTIPFSFVRSVDLLSCGDPICKSRDQNNPLLSWLPLGCNNAASTPGPTVSELADERLAVHDIEISQIGDRTYSICVVVSSNTSDLVTTGTCDTPPQCDVLAGDQYCDVALLRTVVTQRR